MTALRPQDLQWVLQRIPQHVLHAIKDSKGRVFVAGGFIRSCIANEPPNDIDMFVSSKGEAKGLAELLALEFRRDYRRGHRDQPRYVETDNAFTISEGYKTPLQIIHRWTFKSPLECIESFDFTIARAAIWWDENKAVVDSIEPGWRSACDDDFYSDLAAKRLVYKAPVRDEDAGGSMLRVLKFYQRGYRIPLDSLGKVMARMFVKVDDDPAKTGLMDSTELERFVAPQLTGMLREVDPDLDPGHVAHLPSMEE